MNFFELYEDCLELILYIQRMKRNNPAKKINLKNDLFLKNFIINFKYFLSFNNLLNFSH